MMANQPDRASSSEDTSTAYHFLPCDEQVEELLREYEKIETQQQFRDLAEQMEKNCEKLLEDIGLKGVVQSRRKDYKSLKTKLDGLKGTNEFMDWFNTYKERDEVNDEGYPPESENLSEPGSLSESESLPESETIKEEARGQPVAKQGQEQKPRRNIYDHPDLGDLAGVRVGLFFPGDALKVAEAINEAFEVTHTFGTVIDTTRSACEGTNKVIQIHGKGRWVVHDPKDDSEGWEHYGYKSWQVVVKWHGPLPELFQPGSVLGNIFNPLKVEIQVGTVVTQAWAEVQHNIIYKRSETFRATPSMRRMIDATNGLAITTDIMLQELERCIEQAEREAEQQREWEKRAPVDSLDWACQCGDVEAVDRLLRDGVDTNEHFIDGSTALHVASSAGHLEVVERLLAAGAKMDPADSWCDTALHSALKKGHLKVAKRLITHGQNLVDIRNVVEETALHIASLLGQVEAVDWLLDAGSDVNSRNLTRSTALMLASKEGHLKVVERLLDGGADVNLKNATRQTALKIASSMKHDEIFKRLQRASM